MCGIHKERDVQLDIYRAVSVLYVLCVTHTLFWLNIGSDLIISILLVEMPVIFFVSGASLSLTKEKTFLKAFINRTKRVILPYYVYSIVLLICITILSLFVHVFHDEIIILLGEELAGEYSYNILNYRCVDFFKILVFDDIPQAHYTTHLWFIFPYMVLTCTFRFQVKLMMFVNRWVYILLCLLVYVGAFLMNSNGTVLTILAYNFFVVFGYLFYKRIENWQLLVIGLFSVLFVVIYVVSGGFFVPMQIHKFPPDLLFVSYNIGFICFLSVVVGNVKIKNYKIFKTWNERGYTIYLYQSVVFSLIYPFYSSCICNIPVDFIKWLVCALVVFGMSTILCKITWPLEKLVIMKLERLRFFQSGLKQN